MNEQYLRPTEYLDYQDPSIKEVLRKIFPYEQGLTNKEKALTIYKFVRDDIKFGFTPYFDRMKASDVLQYKVGFCNTKANLFCALCRAVGIPTRAHYVSLNADILRGFVNPGPYVNHAYSEVFINGKWVKVDSYTVDKQLVEKAKRKLELENSYFGYGVHIDGQTDWDGENDTFIQFVNNGKIPNMTLEDFGTFSDSQEFDKSRKGVQYNFFVRGIMYFALSRANSAVESLRSAAIN